MVAFITAFLVAGLAVLVALTVSVIRGSTSSSTSAQVAREVQAAKQEITAIHEQARSAIMDEAFRRAQGQAAATRLDRFPSQIGDGDDRLG